MNQHVTLEAESIGDIGREVPRARGRAILSKRNGAFLTHNEYTASYAIIRYNIRTYRSDGVIAVIAGKQNAELELKKLEAAQDSSDRHEGWRYLIDATDLKAGTDPAEANQHREAELEKRESKALRATTAANFSSPPRQR
ncbi:MAG TPA: hypothetical protein VH596_13440 [Terriglobales bacterium]